MLCLPGSVHSQRPAGLQPSIALTFLPQGKYRVRGSRVALILSSPGVSAAAAAALDGVFQALGFENCEKRKVSVQVTLTLQSSPSATVLVRSWGLTRLCHFLVELPRGAEFVPGAAGYPEGCCGVCPCGLDGPQWAAEAATAAGSGAESLWGPAGLPQNLPVAL